MSLIPAIRPHTLKTIGWAIVTYASLGVGIGAYRYVMGDPWNLDATFRDKYVEHLFLVRMHGATAILALLLGPFQFWTELRILWPRLHRIMGWLYFVGIVGGSITGFYMGTMAYGGISSKIAFSSMSALWLYTGLRAIQCAVRRDIRAHRRWMTRNFVLTFGAVLVRIYLAGLMELGFDFERVYSITSWCAWIPNIVATELIFAWKDGYFGPGARRKTGATQTRETGAQQPSN